MLLQRYSHIHAHTSIRPTLSTIPLRLYSDTNKLSTPDTRASSKLFADAKLEEGEGDEQQQCQTQHSPPSVKTKLDTSSRILAQQLESQSHPNWDGDESVRDAVLRMLVDKYKPVKVKVGSVDEGVKRVVAGVNVSGGQGRLGGGGGGDDGDSGLLATGSSTSTSTDSLLANTDTHKPWLVTFTPPSHNAINIKHMSIPPRTRSSHATTNLSNQESKNAKRRNETTQRLSRAREETLDYKLGIRNGGGGSRTRASPVGMKGWASLVEERIERARSQGQFTSLPGHGKPLPSHNTLSHNPFIEREEFLMNRIVQRNGAAPAWVELQNELDAELSAFRRSIQTSYTRYAIRHLTSSLHDPTSHSPPSTPTQPIRFPNWEHLHNAYHLASLTSLNSLIRRYNAVAPYPVRRPVLTLEGEMKLVSEASWAKVIEGIEGRVRSKERTDSSEEDVIVGGSMRDGESESHVWRVVREFVERAVRWRVRS